MKKIIFFYTALFGLSNCDKFDDTPKCSDLEIQETVISILQEKGTRILKENRHLEHIITTEKNSELKSCGCQATLPGEYWYISRGYNNKNWINPTIYYDVQKTDNGEHMVTVDLDFY